MNLGRFKNRHLNLAPIISGVNVGLAVGLLIHTSLSKGALIIFIFVALILTAGSLAGSLFSIWLATIGTLILSQLIGVVGITFTPPWVATTVIGGSFIFATFAQHRQKISSAGLRYFDAFLSLFALGMGVMFRTQTQSSSSRLLGFLAAEDNASWIHAMSGFSRFGVGIGEVTSSKNGVDGALAVIMSTVSQVAKIGLANYDDDIQLVLVSTLLVYFLLIIGFFVVCSSACMSLSLWHGKPSGEFDSVSKALGYTFVAVPAASACGLLMAIYGHLSLIAASFGIWATIWFIGHSSYATSSKPTRLNLQKWISGRYWIVALSMVGIGSLWWPLIPYVLFVELTILSYFLYSKKESKAKLAADSIRTLLTRKSGLHAVKILGVVCLTTFVFVRNLRLPTEWGLGFLINTSGGALGITEATLSISVFGILAWSVLLGRSIILSAVLIGLPLELIAVWILTLQENPTNPPYSVQKLSVLVAIVGLPLLVAYVTNWIQGKSRNLLLLILAPILAMVAVANLSFSINMFPRSALYASVDEPFWAVKLVALSAEDKDRHIVCIGNDSSLDGSAYFCSRFAASLQFKERGDGEFQRRWRSQLLGLNVDRAEIKEERDFKVNVTIQEILNSQKRITVLVLTGPITALLDRPEEWIQRLVSQDLDFRSID